MKKLVLILGLLSGLDAQTQAQTSFSLGPKVGINVNSANYIADDRFASHSALTGTTSFLPRFEAGLLATINWGHWQLQPAVLYAQKAFIFRVPKAILSARTALTRPLMSTRAT
jgi:hypothetical protein